MKIIDISKARKNLTQLVDEIHAGRSDGFVIQRYGRNIVAIVPVKTQTTTMNQERIQELDPA